MAAIVSAADLRQLEAQRRLQDLEEISQVYKDEPLEKVGRREVLAKAVREAPGGATRGSTHNILHSMIVAVIDTNVLLSGILGYARRSSTPGEILRRWRQGDFRLVLSPPLLDELEDTLSRVSPILLRGTGRDRVGWRSEEPVWRGTEWR